MVRLVLRLLPYVLLLAGVTLLLVGVTTLCSTVETSPTAISIADLEAGRVPDAEWIQVTDGHPILEEVVTWNEEEKKTGKKTTLGHYVPLASRALLDRWADDPAAVRGRASLIVLVKDEDLLKKLVANQGSAFSVSGVRQQGGFARHGKQNVKDALAGFDFGHMLYLEQGSSPLQKGEALVLLPVSAGVFLLGWLWLKRRRRQAAQLSAAAVGGIAAGVAGGVKAGVQSGLAEAREKGG